MIPRRALVLIVALLAAHQAVAANEDEDLNLIPPAAQAPTASPPPAPEATSATKRNYVENALSLTPLRDSLAVPYPPPKPASWEDRLFLDSRDEWDLGDRVSFTYSGRFNLRAENSVEFPSHESVRNDLREAYLSWHPDEGSWIDLGRVNVKSGVAVGFNPTDYFRSRAVVEPLTADPAILREDRLGTLVLLGQHVWTGGSVTAVYAPKVTQPTAIYNNFDLPSLDPMLDRTNAEHRFLLKGSLAITNGFSPELLVYHAGNRTQLGANLTTSVNQQTIAYLEWSGGPRPSLADDAVAYGRATGTLPRTAPAPMPIDSTSYFRNELATGFSYSPPETRLSFNLEYHFNQAGFTPQDWRNWFDAGARHGSVPGVDASLWYIRSYAQDQQEPLSRHSVFLRAAWTDAFVHDLDLTALANIDLQDGSGLVQVTADYYLSRAWTIGAQAGLSLGTRRSEFGSLPQSAGILFRVARYL